MDYAVIAARSETDRGPLWQAMPYLLQRLIMKMLPPRTVQIPGGLIFGAGEGAIISLPIGPETASALPQHARQAVTLAIARARQRGARIVALSNELLGCYDEATVRGAAVSAAALLGALLQALKADGRKNAYKYPFALIGASFMEVLSIFQAVSEFAGSVEISGAKPLALQRVAREVWQKTGIVPRIHRNPLHATKSSKITFIADTPPSDIEFAQDSVVIDLRRTQRPEERPSQIVAHGGSINSPKLTFSSSSGHIATVVEAAMLSVENGTKFSSVRPSTRDLEKILATLAKSELSIEGVNNGKDTVSVVTLTLILS